MVFDNVLISVTSQNGDTFSKEALQKFAEEIPGSPVFLGSGSERRAGQVLTAEVTERGVVATIATGVEFSDSRVHSIGFTPALNVEDT